MVEELEKKIKQLKIKVTDCLPLGCMGSKKNELKRLLPIIKPQLNDNTIFIEPFCGSSIVSFNIYKLNNKLQFHINDNDYFRIKFYNKMKNENDRNDLYNLEKEILKQGEQFYYNIVKNNERNEESEYNKYVISKRIHSFRHGLFPTTKKIILHDISINWINFFNNSIITNYDYKDILDKYKDNENAFIYLDPPYLDSYNGSYGAYKTEDKSIITDNTGMYIIFLEYLKNCKCKVLFSINSNAITRYLYKDYIKDNYQHIYQSTQIKKNNNKTEAKRKEGILIISNF